MPRPDLTPEQRAEADRIHLALRAAADADLRALAELLASKDDRSTLGPTEFAVRDIVHRIGAKALTTALEGRKKGAPTAPPAPAPAAPRPPSSSAGRPSAS
jgi:hypothetical protein